jgi:hypothetical protein
VKPGIKTGSLSTNTLAMQMYSSFNRDPHP